MSIDVPSGDIQGFGHVRVVIGLVTGLSVTRILNEFSRFVQHPGKMPIYLAHFIWALFMLLFVTHFWWFQFGLSAIENWEYPEYAFIVSYAALIFFSSHPCCFPTSCGNMQVLKSISTRGRAGFLACLPRFFWLIWPIARSRVLRIFNRLDQPIPRGS